MAYSPTIGDTVQVIDFGHTMTSHVQDGRPAGPSDFHRVEGTVIEIGTFAHDVIPGEVAGNVYASTPYSSPTWVLVAITRVWWGSDWSIPVIPETNCYPIQAWSKFGTLAQEVVFVASALPMPK